MKLLDQLERKFGRYAVPNITLLIICLQVFGFILINIDRTRIETLLLTRAGLEAGEYWRLATFLAMPICGNLFWFAIGMMFLHFSGGVLEVTWGTFKYNLYLLCGYLISVGIAVAEPAMYASTDFLTIGIMLAFATLLPDYVIRIMLVFPIPAKVIGWCIGGYYGWQLIAGPYVLKLVAVGALGNYLLFFTRTLIRNVRRSGPVRELARAATEATAKPFHECRICGASDRSNPEKEFRYCSQCAGTPCYCEDHIRDHEHIVETQD